MKFNVLHHSLPSRLIVLTFAILASLANSITGAEPWIPMFNGKDLQGWRGDSRVWSVKDGVIQGSTEGIPSIEKNTFLIWDGEPLADFEFQVEYRILSGNSGIQYRSHVTDEGTYSVAGYQADIDAEGTYTGILYEEGGRGILTTRGQRTFIGKDDEASRVQFASADKRIRGVSRGEWNTYVIRARGPVLQHRINGRIMSETEDQSSARAAASGGIAFQVHSGPAMKVQFRHPKYRVLPATAGNSTESATPAESLTVLDQFAAELIYSVPAELNASWVSLAVDPRGRLIASDQDGKLFRVTPAKIGSDPRATFVEPLTVPIGSAQGMCFAGDRFYVVVNRANEKGPGSGLYRVLDSDADDAWDTVVQLRAFEGEGEHGPHAVIPDPSGQRLFVVAGNHTRLPPITSSRVPRNWQEDQLLHRLWDARGHAVGILAPGGWICTTDLDGRSWELFACGFRNAYDLALDQSGNLFTFDSDMEWDIGAPWYRPTRVYHVPSGAEFGWRSGSGKWPSSFPDCLPPVLDHGPGSPTGVTFGYDTGFPDEFRRALFIGDWSFGRIDYVQLKPRGASFEATAAPFVMGTPLPVTDIVANRQDGALYFAIGGRQTQSGLYRVTYTGPTVSTSEVDRDAHSIEATERRRKMESTHGRENRQALSSILAELSNPDRFVRYAARVALEWQPVPTWERQVLTLKDAAARIEGCVALARCSSPRDRHRIQPLIHALLQLKWDELDPAQRLAWLRACELVLIRTECRDPQVLQRVGETVFRRYPSGMTDQDMAMGRLLVFCRMTPALPMILDTMVQGSTQEERIAAAYNLRSALPIMSPNQQEQYFSWFTKLDRVRGGESLRGFLRMIRDDAAASLNEATRKRLEPLITAVVTDVAEGPIVPTGPVVEDYTVDRVVEIVEESSSTPSAANGRIAFAKALCFHCHRIGAEGGATGPDLTTAHRRFSVPYLAESMVVPDREISDRFRTSTFVLQDGKVITGRVANMVHDEIRVLTDMLNPGSFTSINRASIEEIQPTQTSEMPKGLLNVLTPDEIRDLFCFLRSEGLE